MLDSGTWCFGVVPRLTVIVHCSRVNRFLSHPGELFDHSRRKVCFGPRHVLWFGKGYVACMPVGSVDACPDQIYSWAGASASIYACATRCCVRCTRSPARCALPVHVSLSPPAPAYGPITGHLCVVCLRCHLCHFSRLAAASYALTPLIAASCVPLFVKADGAVV